MKKRIASLLLVLCLCATLLPTTAMAYNTGDDYPSEYKNATADSVTDQWNFFNRECTSFVAWCLNSRNGVSFTNRYGGVLWGHVKDWGGAARSLGITVDMNPVVGAVAWWDTGTYGHVAWVKAVSGNTTIYTSEKKKVVSSTWRGDETTDQTSDECSLAAGTYYICVEGMIGNRKDETYWITIKTAAGNQPDSGDIVAPFTDVKASAYYAEPVKWAVDHGVTVGTSTTTFSPDATCTNAQILTFIWRAAGSPTPSLANPFTNLAGSEYYAKAAVWAYSMGMVSGTAFDANKACTRAMTMEYLWKQAGSPAVAASGKFTDVPSSAAYATAVAWAVNNGITAGTSNTTFSPDSICTRGQIMTFLYRAEG